MYLILKRNGHNILQILTECKSEISVIRWYEHNKYDDALVLKADSIKDFIKKSE